MGFLQKLGLVEEVPTEEQYIPEELETVEEEPIVEAELEDVNTDTLIDDIYSQNELSDKSKSIFKVEELINTLPKEMVTETKRASVLAILTSFGLTEVDVLTDGENRISILDAISKKITNEGTTSIGEKSAQIEELKKSIAELELEISNEQNEIKMSNESINNEINRINGLIKFIGGTN